MTNTVLIEQTAKNIKLAGIAFVGFMTVRIWRWWMPG